MSSQFTAKVLNTVIPHLPIAYGRGVAYDLSSYLRDYVKVFRIFPCGKAGLLDRPDLFRVLAVGIAD